MGTKTQSRAITISQYVLLGTVVGASFVLPFDSALRSWITLVGFTLLGFMFVSGTVSMQRRSALAFGAYMLTCAAQFSVPHLWRTRPDWWDARMLHVTFAVVCWLIVAVLLDRRSSSEA